MTVEKPWKLAKTRLPFYYTTKHPIGPLSGAGFSYYAQHMGHVKQKMASKLKGEGIPEKNSSRKGLMRMAFARMIGMGLYFLLKLRWTCRSRASGFTGERPLLEAAIFTEGLS